MFRLQISQEARAVGLSLFIWRFRKAALLLIVVLCAAGLYSVQTLPLSIFPDLTAPRIIVTASAGDAPIPAMLANVTRPLENAIASVPGVTRIGSVTQPGEDELDVNFNWGTDMQTTLQLVNAKVAQLQPTLPPNTQVSAERLNPSVFPIMGYSLTSPAVSPLELRRAALYTLRPRLLRVAGVQQIMVTGGDSPDYQVTLDPQSLLTRGVTVSDVETALTKNNEINSVGHYDRSFLRYEILVSGLFQNAQDIARVTVTVKNRIPVTIGELGTVKASVEPRTVETSGSGKGGVRIDVVKQAAGNTVQVADGIQKAIAAAKKDLPPGITVTNFYDQSEIVKESQSSVLEAIVVGAILALLVLMLFLGNLRTASVVLIILPLTIVITFGLMKALGQTLNIMTLGALAIALGLVIDDGIVVVENIFHELEQGRSRPTAIAAGLRAITPAMIGSSLSTMAAFLPLTFLKDLTGQFFGPLALVMIATLTVSLTLALLLTPLLAEWLLPEKISHSATSGIGQRLLAFFPRQFERVRHVYARLLGWCLAHRLVVIILLLPLAGVVWLLASHLQTGFFPEFDEGGFVLDYQLPPGTSLAETSHVSGQIETVLAQTPDIAAWSRQTGAQNGFDITTQNSGDITVRLKSGARRDINEIMDDVRQQVQAKYPSADVDFKQILQDNIGDIAGSPSPVQVKIFGPDQATLETLAQKVDEILSKTPHVVDDNNGIVHSNPTTYVTVDSERAQIYGLTADDVTQAAEAAIQGAEPTTVQQGEEPVPVHVTVGNPEQTLNPDVLHNIPIASPATGGDVPLDQVARIQVRSGDSQPTRENQRLMLAVTASISGSDLGSVTAEIQRRIGQQVKLPTGYTIEYGGLYESQQQSFTELGQVLVVAALFVLTLLVVQFRSLRQAIALLVAALLSLSGVLLALFLTKTQLNISSFTGAIMIVGIITENGIVLFELFNRLREGQPESDLISLMISAGEQRLRPILMTTIGAILALSPLTLGLGAGAALQRPLAIAVVGGLFVSVYFTLLVAPVIYISLEKIRPSRSPILEQQEMETVQKDLASS